MKTMDRGCCSIQLLFLCIWLGLFPTFCISVNGLTGDVVEGDTVRLQCNTTDMQFGYEVQWWAYYSDSRTQITRNEECIISSCSLDTTFTSSRSKIEVLTIRNIGKTTVYYQCSVHSQIDNGSLAADGMFLWVHYFPSLSCYPRGPFTVQEGKGRYMSCSSEIGKPNVNVHIVSSGESYTWYKSSNHYMTIWLYVRATDNGSSFDCSMNSSASRFSGMGRNCTIGPMTVVPMTTPSITTTQPTTDHLDASISTAASPPHTASWESTTASEEDADGGPSSISALLMTTPPSTTTQQTTDHLDASISTAASPPHTASWESTTASEEDADGGPSSISALLMTTPSSTTTRPTTEHLDASISTAASQHTASWKSTTASEEDADASSSISTLLMTTPSSTTTRPTTEPLDVFISTAASQHTASWKSTTASEEDADGGPSSISTLPVIVAFSVILLIFFVSVIINIIFIVKYQRSKSKETVLTNAVKTNNVELQFEGDRAIYNIPTSKTTLQDQDCRQNVKNASKRSEEDVSSTYEAVDDLQSKKNPMYQNVRY
ncbi:uncharacterized protein [Asterias amurensis]|uniref:uncharacterized protein n=1 Tax=Asterias amurensis TaxID=7602 RepID=UPI003AB334D3